MLRPKKLYKFLNRNHVPKMLERGTIRIGTAKEFRVVDGKSGARSDATEMQTIWTPPAGIHQFTEDHPFVKSLGIKPKPGSGIETDGTSTILIETNAYLYSTSWQITNNLKLRMAQEFDADACIRIDDIHPFLSALQKHPFFSGREVLGDRVSYVSSKAVAKFAGNDVFQKEFSYGWQKEFRFVWSKEPLDTGAIIDVPGIVPFISRVY